MVTAIQTATRESGLVIGNSLKTIFSRINMDETQNALRSIGIEAKTSAGELRPVGEVYAELAAKWDTLSRATKTQIATQMAK